MRNRAAVAIALLSILPAALYAQRGIPRVPGSKAPGSTREDGEDRQPEPIRRAQAITRSRFSMESSPVLAYTTGASLAANYLTPGFLSFGGAAHVEYRTSNLFAASANFTGTTSSDQGTAQSFELGARYRPRDWDHAFRPYADLSAAYLRSSSQYNHPTNLTSPFGLGTPPSLGMQYAHGYGLTAGAGGELWFASSWAITTGVSALHGNMMSFQYDNSSHPGDTRYSMNTYRLLLGLKFSQAQNISGLKQPR